MPWADSSREAFRFIRGFIHKVLSTAPPLAPGELKARLGVLD